MVLQGITEDTHIDWTRFDYYAQHVRKFTWNECNDVAKTTLSDLPRRRDPGSHSLLPNLTCLRIRESREEHISKLSFLFAPSVTTFELFALGDCDPDHALRAAQKTCNRLDTLLVKSQRYGAFSGTAGDALAQCVQGNPNLRRCSFSVSLTSADTVRALAQLPHLTNVSDFALTRDDTDSLAYTLKHTAPATWFPALQRLTLTVEELNNDTAAILKSIQSTELTDLQLISRRHPDTSELKRTMEALAGAPYARTLTSLTIELALQTSPPECPAIDLALALRPLYPLRQLCHLAIEGRRIQTTEATLDAAANAFPHLQLLHLLSKDHPHPMGQCPCPSLRTLLTLAEKCPRLLSICIHFDVHSVADIPTDAEVERVLALLGGKHGLEQLRMYGGTLSLANWDEEDVLADFLMSLFQSVQPDYVRRTLGQTASQSWYNITNKVILG